MQVILPKDAQKIPACNCKVMPVESQIGHFLHPKKQKNFIAMHGNITHTVLEIILSQRKPRPGRAMLIKLACPQFYDI